MPKMSYLAQLLHSVAISAYQLAARLPQLQPVTAQVPLVPDGLALRSPFV